MLNGEFTNEQAATLAERLRARAPGDLADQVRRAIRLTTGREPDRRRGEEATWRSSSALQAEDELTDARALTQYCLLALNANDSFTWIDRGPKPRCDRSRRAVGHLAPSRPPVLRPHPPRVPLGGRRRVRVGRPSPALLGARRLLRQQAAAADGVDAVRQPDGPEAAARRRPRPRASSSCSCTAGPATSTRSTTSRSSTRSTARRSRSRRSAAAGKKNEGRVVGPKWEFKPYGQCGKMVSRPVPAPRHRASTTSRSSTPCTPSRRSTARPC